MKKTPLFFYILLLTVSAQFIYPQDEESSGTNESMLINGLIAGAEGLLSSIAVGTFNVVSYLATGTGSWAIPTKDSIYKNFTQYWEWEDTDGFIVNQFGHPYHGSTYFSAGRVNGFGFYESIAFNALGSFLWESIGESNHASINDLIVTITGSTSVGEIIHRLYLEAIASGVPAPAAFFINPMAGFHYWVTGQKPPDYGKNLYALQYNFGTGYAKTNYSLLDDDTTRFSFSGFSVNASVSAIYGNPFTHESNIPFSHFELDASLASDFVNYMEMRIVSDGYLFSFAPVYTSTDMMSTGLSLQFDCVALGELYGNYSTINQFSNALNWTVKYQHLFSEKVSFQTKIHFGPTFLGVSEYYSPVKERDLNNFGGGLNSKLFFNFEHAQWGKLETSILGYVIWTYPQTSAITTGTVYWLFVDLTYSRPISERLSVGITDSFALERGIFANFSDTAKYNNAVKLFVALNF